jgi:hypothetical protein
VTFCHGLYLYSVSVSQNVFCICICIKIQKKYRYRKKYRSDGATLYLYFCIQENTDLNTVQVRSLVDSFVNIVPQFLAGTRNVMMSMAFYMMNIAASLQQKGLHKNLEHNRLNMIISIFLYYIKNRKN